MWLVSVPTAAAVWAAVVGAVAMRALTGIPAPADLIAGAVGGWLVGTLILGPPAERLDRRLHRMGGGRRGGQGRS